MWLSFSILFPQVYAVVWNRGRRNSYPTHVFNQVSLKTEHPQIGCFYLPKDNSYILKLKIATKERGKQEVVDLSSVLERFFFRDAVQVFRNLFFVSNMFFFRLTLLFCVHLPVARNDQNHDFSCILLQRTLLHYTDLVIYCFRLLTAGFFAKGYLDDVLSHRERKRAVWPWPSREEGKTMSRPMSR